jgi:DNA-binding HxlR family transcriptional regulator
MISAPDLELTRAALATSTLSHGLKVFGDRWTVQVMLSAFLGVRRFDELQSFSNIPRPTLSDRLRSLVQIGVLKPRLYQDKPARYEYHLTRKGLGLYDATLMVWAWEKKWGNRALALPQTLHHTPCGHSFSPVLTCLACCEKVTMKDLKYTLVPNARLQHEPLEGLRTPRMSGRETAEMSLGLRVDRWSLLVLTAVVLGCHYFDQITHVLGIGPNVLSRRLSGMVEAHLLHCETDVNDARRRLYRLTPSSRDLFGYIVCLSNWAGESHLHEPSSIRPRHPSCKHNFSPRVACDHCQQTLNPWDVSFTVTQGSTA